MDALLEAADADVELETENIVKEPTTPLQEKASLLKPATASASEENGSGDGDDDEADGKENGDGSDSDDDGTLLPSMNSYLFPIFLLRSHCQPP